MENNQSKIQGKLKRIEILKSNQDWLQDSSSCQLIGDTVFLLDGSSQNHLYFLTPFILRLTDDYLPKNKLIGLECIKSLMEVYSLNDLQTTNFHQLFWQTLKQMLFNDDYELNQLLIPTLIIFIEKFSLERKELDECFNQLVKNVAFCKNKPLKAVYLKGVHQFLLEWPIKLIKFTKSILKVILETLQDVIDKESLHLVMFSCEILCIIIENTPKLIYVYIDQVLIALIKCQFNIKDTQSLDDNQSKEIIRNIQRCICLLKKHDSKVFKDYCDTIETNLLEFEEDLKTVKLLLNCN